MTALLAIDPGPIESAWVLYESGIPARFGKDPNDVVLGIVSNAPVPLAVEMIASYGMPVGREVFDTCVWIGRFIEAYPGTQHRLVYRKDVKLHLCQSPRANDATIRQAIIDRYGPGKELAIGRKANPGPLYGVKADIWAALGVAITASETRAA